MLQISKGHDLEQNSRHYVHLYDMSDLYEIKLEMQYSRYFDNDLTEVATSMFIFRFIFSIPYTFAMNKTKQWLANLHSNCEP